MTDPEPLPEPAPAEGFQMSPRRAWGEIAVVVGILGAAVVLVVGLARSAASWLAPLVPLGVDRTLGEHSARLIGMGSKPCTDPSAKKYVEAVAAPLIAALQDRQFQFSFVVVEAPEVNAFALPGGFVTVHSGLLESAESGDEVAAVLAHEIHHVTLRHGTQRMLRELGASALLSAVFGGTDIAVPAKAAHDFVSNAYDREQESEADAQGLSLMVRAGLDPRGMSRFFERLAKTGLTPPALLSTHPDPGDRAETAARAAKGAHVTTVLPSPKGVKCK